jgi:hypothetical protein
MAEVADSLTIELLTWISSGRRTYGDVMEAWRSSCPRHPVWENAIADGLVQVEGGGTQAQARVTLTPRGRAVLDGEHGERTAPGTMRTLKIDIALFMHEFERDPDASDFVKTTYLDLTTGDTHSVYEEDEDAHDEVGISAEENAELRQRVESRPDEYLAIPGLVHAEHHDVLLNFLNSRWTNDEGARARALDAYSGSIGRWKRAVPRNVVDAYHEFCDTAIQHMAEDFLREHGISPVWK